MTIAQLDIIFPYVCFAYGAVMTLVLASKTLARIADDKLPSEMVARWRSHRALAITCLLVGGAWILQGIWLS